MVSWSEDLAETASFLAAVPPLHVAERIQQLQQQAGIATNVPPHVTVKAQPGLQDGIAWRERVATALGRLDPFEIALSGVGWFGRGIVYLEVSGPIVQLHWTVLRAVESAGAGERFEYDGESYVPHLTLGAEFAGASVEQLKAIASGARDLCGVCFTVGEVVEFHRSSATGAYIPTTRFPLGAKSGSGGAASSAPQ